MDADGGSVSVKQGTGDRGQGTGIRHLGFENNCCRRLGKKELEAKG
jgi:hypothetical protein